MIRIKFYELDTATRRPYPEPHNQDEIAGESLPIPDIGEFAKYKAYDRNVTMTVLSRQFHYKGDGEVEVTLVVKQTFDLDGMNAAQSPADDEADD